MEKEDFPTNKCCNQAARCSTVAHCPVLGEINGTLCLLPFGIMFEDAAADLKP
jgi:hypothetical protein